MPRWLFFVRARCLAIAVFAAFSTGCWSVETVLMPRSDGAVGDGGRAIGQWIDITPVAAERSRWADLGVCDPTTQVCTYGSTGIALDPSDPSIVYLTIDLLGIWRSPDSGVTWARLGSDVDRDPSDGTTSYLDSAIDVAVDPRDPSHLYAAQGTHGTTRGFWISRDTGATWTQPIGFRQAM
jgi:hypothetical protein